MNNKQLYKITLTREQLMLISQCVEDISRFAAGDIDLQHTTDTLINDMDGAETLMPVKYGQPHGKKLNVL